MARLAAAEQSCCAFLQFTLDVEAGHLRLTVRAPEGAQDVVDALFPPLP